MGESVTIKSIRHWHEQIVDYMLQNPHKTQGQMADFLDKTQSWVSSIIHTDLFQEYKSRRFQQHQDGISHSVITRVSGLAELSLEVLHQRIEDEKDSIPLGIVKDSAELTLKALGYGPKPITAGAQTLNLNLNGASPTILAAAREDMRAIHRENTAPEGDAIDDAEILNDSIHAIGPLGPNALMKEQEDEQPQLPLFGEP